MEASIITWKYKNTDVFIAKIHLVSLSYLFKFRRLSFSLRLIFAMTIHISIEKTLKVVGLNLRIYCFAHGQLYIGSSRVNREEMYLF